MPAIADKQSTFVPVSATQPAGSLLTKKIFGPVRAQLLLFLLVVLGLCLRSYHYLTDPPVWHDEAAQIYNVLHKDYTEILGPLFYSEACPPLFLAVEKAVVQLLGDGTYALRLLPFLSSCIVFVALIFLARPILSRSGLLWFALLLGCSDRLLWHACEAKPYAVDVLVATFVLALGLGFDSAVSPRVFQRLLIATALATPLMIFLTFPACFLLGGLALVLAPEVFRSRCNATRLLYVAFCILLAGSFLLLYITAVKAQRNSDIESCWTNILPDWNQPWLVPVIAFVRVSETARYAVEPVGNALAVLAVVGGTILWRSGRKSLLGLLLSPIALNVVAWFMSSYPLGASRVNVYTVPAVLLLIGLGIPPALAWFRRWGLLPQIALIVLLMVPMGQVVKVFIKPWVRLDSASPSAFALEHRLPHEPVVGTYWEQAYYCRELGPLYRFLRTASEPPSLPPAAKLAGDGTPTADSVKSLWLLASHDPGLQTRQIEELVPGGPWRVVERYPFRDIVVLRLKQ